MSTVIQLKRSETASSTPGASDLAVGELAVNLADAKLYSKKTDGTIVTLGQETTQSYWLNGDLGAVTDTITENFDLGSIADSGTDISATFNNLVASDIETSTFKIGTQQFPASDGNNGQVITTNGSGVLSWSNQSGGSGGGLSAWTEKSSAYTASAGDRLIVDVSSSTVTITLPASPGLGDEVAIIDGSSNAATNNITIARNGSNIDGAAADLTIDVDGAATNLVYYNSTYGWIFSER